MAAADFMAGGLASISALFFTNPLDVIKVRIQLQGELAARGTHALPYKGIVHAFVTVARNDGWAGLQKGLVPAMYIQFIVNSIRLGVYNNAVNNHWTQTKKGVESFGLSLFWGGLGAAMGAYVSSPFLMIGALKY